MGLHSTLPDVADTMENPLATPTASIVIPAHNEERAIRTGLTVLLADSRPGEFSVVVVANGCIDATAMIARQVGRELDREVTVIETPHPSKTASLNLGDSTLGTFPRIYLDADVLCPTDTARALVTALDRHAAELVVPSRRLDLVDASIPVRSYYKAWQRLDAVRAGLAGRGVYAFSRTGRARFGRFPDLVADDYWAVSQAPEGASRIIPEEVTVRPPANLRALLRVRSRVYAANRSLGRTAGPEGGARQVARLLDRPGSLPSALAFLALTALARARAYTTDSGVSLGAGRDEKRGARR